MQLQRILVCGFAGLVLAGGGVFAAGNGPTNAAAATAAVYVPDTTHENESLPDGVLAWDDVTKRAKVAADAGIAQFSFSFTNISGGQVVILDVHPSCGCTTAQLPPMPWIVPAGTDGHFGLTVNVAGKTGTLAKSVTVRTDKGFKQLMLQIDILPQVIPSQSEAERAQAMELAKADRQAVFRDNCATCHVKPGTGKYGKPLYDAVCGICHESEHRASMVPDLHNIKTPTNLDFWQTWIAHGKAGTLMPAFSSVDGGPLSDMQVTTLAQYLATTIPSHPAANQ